MNKCYIFYFLIGITFLFNIICIEHDLDLHGDGKLEKIILPFQYEGLTEAEKRNPCLFVSEGRYAFLKDDKQCEIVGPLRPCQLIVMQDDQKTVVAHHDGRSSTENLIDINKQYFTVNNTKNTLTLFTNRYHQYENSIFYQFHNKLAQNDSLMQNKKRIQNHFGIPEQNIKTILLEPVPQLYPTQYHEANAYVKVTKESIYSISPVKENIFLPALSKRLPIKMQCYLNYYAALKYGTLLANERIKNMILSKAFKNSTNLSHGTPQLLNQFKMANFQTTEHYVGNNALFYKSFFSLLWKYDLQLPAISLMTGASLGVVLCLSITKLKFD